MRILPRYLAREMMGPFFFGVLAFAGIWVGFSFISLAQQPLLTGFTALRLTILAIPENLIPALAMGSLLGTLFTLSQLSGHSEIVAMRAGGFSLTRLVAPFLVYGIAASLASFLLASVVIPATHRAFLREKAKALGQSTEMILRRQVLPPEFGPDGRLQRLIYVDEFDTRDLYLRGVLIQEFDRGRLHTTVQADELIWDGQNWRFQRGKVFLYAADGSIARMTVNGGHAAYQPLLPKPREISVAAKDPLEMTWGEYRAFIAQRAKAGVNVRRFLVDFFTNRLAIPLACLALTVVGAPLGIQSHRAGTAISFGLALVLLVAYFFLLSLGGVLGKTILPPLLGASLANLTLMALGVGLFVRKMR